MSKGRRVGTAHHPPPNQRQHRPQSRPSRCWSITLLTILPMVIFWPRIAVGQLIQSSAGDALVGEETSPLQGDGVGSGKPESMQPSDLYQIQLGYPKLPNGALRLIKVGRALPRGIAANAPYDSALWKLGLWDADLALEAPADLEWGEPLPTDPTAPGSETPDALNRDAEPAPNSPPVESQDPVYLRPSEACPADYETLVTSLLRDLPQYANLVAARSFRSPMVSPAPDTENPATPAVPAPTGTMLIASQPDFEPIDLTDRAFGAGLDPESDIRQVFFTTLERQYLSDQVVSLQQFHWLFLVQAEGGWRSALIYSSLGGDPASPLADQRLTPPQESSQGVVGQAVRLWLRDCRAGAVFPPASSNL